jgi:hypothetical protein
MFKNYPAITPFVSILSKLSSRDAFNSRVDWTEQEEMPTRIVISATASSSATAITSADHYTYVKNHDLLWNPRTFELIKVEGFTTEDTTIDVVRGWGDTSGKAIMAGDILEILSSSYYEGSEEARPRQPLNTNYYNYTAEIEDFIRTSTRVMNEKSFFAGKGGKRQENLQKMFRAWKIKFEKTLLFSYRSDTVSTETGYTSQYIKTMGGLVEKLRNGSNFLDVGDILTESIFDNWLVDVYTGMPDTTGLAFFMAPHVYKIFNYMAKPLIRLSPNSKKYGMALNQYQGAINVDLIPHPLLDGPEMKGWGFLVDLDYIKLVYQKKPELQLDVAMKRYSYIEDKMYALASLIVSNEKRHGFMINAQG